MKNNHCLDLEMSVADLLERWPAAIPVFMRHNMACVGCSMSNFETLGGAAQVYGLPPEDLLHELYSAIDGNGGPRQ